MKTAAVIIEAESARDRLAVGILEAIRAEADRIEAETGPSPVVAMLRIIAGRLFDNELRVRQLIRLAGSRDNNLPMLFRDVVGEAPGQYMTQRRMQIAREILTETDAPVWAIAEVIGYGSIQTFSRAFERECGQRPTRYRWAHRKQGEPRPEARRRRPIPIAEPQFGRRALAGELTVTEARVLIRCLVALYVGGSKPTGQPPSASAASEVADGTVPAA